MFDDIAIRTTDMPAEMQSLLRAYPRDTWEAHPGFRDKTRQWLSAHEGFRSYARLLREDAEDFLDREVEADRFAARLSRYGGRLVGNLHGHHSWEDHRYFPELSRADPRFDAGLELLEQDHADLDQVLDGYTRQANRVIKLAHLDPAQAREETATLHHLSGQIEAFLDRHLGDEEDLAVPIILHHRLRG